MAAVELVIVAGVRPQYVKARAILWLLERYAPDLRERTRTFDLAQHFTPDVSDQTTTDIGLVFDERARTPPIDGRTVRLGHSLSYLGEALGSIAGNPAVLVFGDASSVMVGGFAAHDLELPLIHVEAGARRDPSEIEHLNSKVVDMLSDVRIAYTQRAYLELAKEGLADGSYVCGDIAREWYEDRYPFVRSHTRRRDSDAPILVSMHRPSNMNAATVDAVACALEKHRRPVRWLEYARTRPFLAGLKRRGFEVVEPQSHSSTMRHLSEASFVLTDSGGLSREAHWFGLPVLMRRDEGGWPELVAHGSLRALSGRLEEDVAEALDWAESLPDIDLSDSPLAIPQGGRRTVEAITTCCGAR